MVANDWDDGCHCCECRGMHCLTYHPGHSHRIDDLQKMDETFGEDIRKTHLPSRKKPEPEEE